MRTAIRVHFLHQHVRDTIVILEEVNPPPNTVPPVQYSGAMMVLEWIPQDNSAVQERVREKTMAIGGGGGKGGDLNGVQRLQDLPQDGPVLQITGQIGIGSVLLLTGGGPKPGKGADGLAENVKDHDKKGGKDADVHIFL